MSDVILHSAENNQPRESIDRTTGMFISDLLMDFKPDVDPHDLQIFDKVSGVG